MTGSWEAMQATAQAGESGLWGESGHHQSFVNEGISLHNAPTPKLIAFALRQQLPGRRVWCCGVFYITDAFSVPNTPTPEAPHEALKAVLGISAYPQHTGPSAQKGFLGSPIELEIFSQILIFRHE